MHVRKLMSANIDVVSDREDDREEDHRMQCVCKLESNKQRMWETLEIR